MSSPDLFGMSVVDIKINYMFVWCGKESRLMIIYRLPSLF